MLFSFWDNSVHLHRFLETDIFERYAKNISDYTSVCNLTFCK